MWLHVAALWAIAVAQPLFELLGDNPEFFVAHRAGAADVVLLALTLAILLPFVLALAVWLIGRAGQAAHTTALGLVVGGLTSLLAMQLTVRAGVAAWFVAIPISLAAGAAVALAHHRWAPVRAFLTILSIAALVTPGLFLSKPGISRLITPRASSAVQQGPSVVPDAVSIATPVVLVVFDELPLLSLLDADRTIDPRLYPNFAALARDGVWYRNATAVSDFTRWALPPIVSGKYPSRAALPSAADYPDTLFTVLGRTHRLVVSEPVTDLCPTSLCPRDSDTAILGRLAAIARDLRVVYLHVILTEDLTAGLPDPRTTWAGFSARADTPVDQAAWPADNPQAVERQWQRRMDAPRVAPVHALIARIEGEGPRPTCYFLHGLVSHYPHLMLPSGQRNGTLATLPARYGGYWPVDQPSAVAQQYQRHLLQVAFVDRLLGELVARLKQNSLYDRALIVITADHGMSFTAGLPQRNISSENAAEIMRVPLVIKYPDRLSVPPHVSDVNAEAIDILPTVAHVLGLGLTWPIDGASLLDPARPGRSSKVVLATAPGRRRDVDAQSLDLEPALQRKLALFGDGADNVHRAPRLPALNDLIGRPVSTLRVSDGGGSVEILRAWDYDDVDPTAPAVVFDVAGRFASPRPETVVAVAVNGRIEAVTRTWERNARGWLATPRLDAWRRGRNALDVFVVDRDTDGPLLRRTSVGQVRPADLNLILDAAASDWGVRQWGFYPVERPAGGAQFRWTRQLAELSNVITHSPPRAVEIGAIRVPGGRPKALKIEANDCVLFEGTVRQGWSSTLSLERCGRSGEGLTLRFTTDAPRGEKDRRRLGIALTRVALQF